MNLLATTYSNIGSVNKTKGDYDNAMKMYDQSLKIRKEIFGEVHESVSNNLQ